MTTISNGTDTITPDLVTGYASARAQRNILHQIIGRGDPDVTFVPSMPRAGTLQLLIVSETGAATAEQLLSTPSPWTLEDSDRPTIDMPFVVVGEVTRTLEDETRDLWLISFGYQEVAP